MMGNPRPAPSTSEAEALRRDSDYPSTSRILLNPPTVFS